MVIAVRTERGSDGLEVVKIADVEVDRRRLRHEATLLARAAHPGVVEVVSTRPGSLRLRHAGTAVARLGPLAPDHAAAVVRRVATTVDDLHQLGLAHTRIDGDHVLVDAHGRPRLCGFAEAVDADAATRAADVAALGALLATMLDRAESVLWSPPQRGLRNAARRKRALGAFRLACAQAQADPPGRRPTARQFASAIHDALPELSLPIAPGDADESSDELPPGAFAEIPGDVDPTSDLAWSDHDLAFLAFAGDPDDDPFAPAPPDDRSSRATDDGPPPSMPAPTPSHPQPKTAPAQTAGIAPIEIRPPSVDHATSEPAGLDRRWLAAIGVVVLIGGIVAGSAIARAVKPFGATETADQASLTADADGGSDEQDPSTSSIPTTSRATPPPVPDGCAAPPFPGPDVDDDGCPDPVTLDGRVAQVGSVRVELGDAGDLVALGDPDCDGVATPALLRPSTGEVFVFRTWSLSDPIEAEATTVVVGADAISSPGPCRPFVVTDAGGGRTQIDGDAP